ncbi:hypothetical protein ABIC83_002889 [Roseateles asaccharophilus]|uniref:hypothetical protein n=1 Tax=Roseateles asaccharophilus TaxID=582607 RepID=UPI0038399F26
MDMEAQAARKVSLPLGVGIFFLPYVFAWLLLNKGYSNRARIVAFGWATVLVFFTFLKPSTSTTPTSPTSGAPASVSVAQQAVAAPASAPEVDPAAERAKNKATMAEIQQRLEKNREKLKGYYANSSAIEKSTNDLITVTAIAVSRGMSKAKEDQQQAAQAKALGAQVSEQLRVMFASSMEEGFVKNGMDARVAATGKGKERLVITYALMSKPLVYKFRNEMDLDTKAKNLGFKKLEYTNGFESSLGETWTVDL